MKSIIALVLSIVCIATVSAQRNKKIKGNGNVVTIERNTSDYEALRIGGSYKIELVEGNEGIITLKGEDNILEYVETEVRSGTLIIKSKNNMNLKPSMGKGVYIIIPVENIDAIRLSGSGKVVGNLTLKTDDMKIQTLGSRDVDLKIEAKSIMVLSSGSSHMRLAGSSEKIDITSSGSSRLKAFELIADKVNITSSGSSHIKILANESINSRTSGSSNISYKGNPKKIQTKASGSSKVKKVSEEF